MDDYEKEGTSYVIIKLDEGNKPQQCIGKLEELLGEYDFHRKAAFALDSSSPCMIYANDLNGCIMVSYGCKGLTLNSKPLRSTRLAKESENSIFIRKLSGDDYLFDKIIEDLNGGEDYEIEDDFLDEGGNGDGEEGDEE